MPLPSSIMDQSRANDEAYDLIVNGDRSTGQRGLVQDAHLTVHDLEVLGEHLQKQYDGIIQAMRAHEFQSFSL
jgi:hypothetical protein